MNQAYEFADDIQKEMKKHLESLGYSVVAPLVTMTVQRKVDLLNYLRSIRTTCELLENSIIQTPETPRLEIRSL